MQRIGAYWHRLPEYQWTAKFSPGSIIKNPNGKIYAVSNLVIDSVTNVVLDYDTLFMSNYSLTKLTTWNLTTAISGTLIHSNGTLDISGKHYANLAGAFILTGSKPMECGNFKVYNDLHIGPNKVIQDECCAGRYIEVMGNLLNEGTIKNAYGGFDVYVKGNVVNNGTISNNNLIFNGPPTQSIEGSQKFSPGRISKSPSGKFNASSALVIDSTTSLDLSDDTLYMGSHNFTKLTTFDLRTDISGSLLHSNANIDIAGHMRANLGGTFTLTGTSVMECSNVTVYGDLKIASGKTITDECCAGRTIIVNGAINNLGTIRTQYGGLSVIAKGAIVNEGLICCSNLQLGGSTQQSIGGGGLYAPGSFWKDPSGRILAATNLTIDSTTYINLDADTLDMGNYTLKRFTRVNMQSNIDYGLLYSNGVLDIGGQLHCSLGGNFVLTGPQKVELGTINIQNGLNIGPNKVVSDECCAGRTITVKGPFFNEGIFMTSYGGIGVEAIGDIKNQGNWMNGYNAANGNGPQKIELVSNKQISGPFYLRATITGNTYQWYKNNVIIPNATGTSYLLDSVSSLQYGVYKVVAGSNSREITVQSTVVGIEPEEITNNTIPFAYELLQNYPNPFNPATSIRYSIASEGVVQLSVYNILGNTVALLVDEYQKPGVYEAVFNPVDLASGVYFYKLKAGTITSIKKMLLLK